MLRTVTRNFEISIATSIEDLMGKVSAVLESGYNHRFKNSQSKMKISMSTFLGENFVDMVF